MKRRTFLAGSIATMGLLRAATSAVRIKIDTGRTSYSIGPDFMGLGYEISSVATPGLLSAANRNYVRLVRTLGEGGVIRVGGNTSDYSSFKPDGTPAVDPNAAVITNRSLHELGTFLKATGWRLIWGLNLGRASDMDAVEEAKAVTAAVGDSLLAFEIGNEPDLFGRGSAGPRPHEYNYDDYLKEYRRYKAAIRGALPGAPFAGPDAAGATDWVTRFAADEGSDLKLLTHHYYRECAGETSTLEKLLSPDPKLKPQLDKLAAASSSSKVPYRYCETNSFCGGGKPGVSDTFGSALWVFDFMFTLAAGGAAGVNIETGVNQLGFVSSYSPIGDDGHKHFTAKPDYYGMLAFAQASRGKLLSVQCDPGAVNITAYAVINDRNRIVISVINKDLSSDADISIDCDRNLEKAVVMRLSAASPESADGVQLGEATVTDSGEWKPIQSERLRSKSGKLELHVPAASAAILKT